MNIRLNKIEEKFICSLADSYGLPVKEFIMLSVITLVEPEKAKEILDNGN